MLLPLGTLCIIIYICIMRTVIYKIENIIDNACYIGSSNNYARRKRRHFDDLKSNQHHSIILQRAYNKYGADAFRIFELEAFAFVSKEKTLEREQYYLDLLKPKYNVSKIAGSNLGLTRTKEFKQKMSEMVKARHQVAWNKGKKGYRKHSDETRLLMSKNSPRRKPSSKNLADMIAKTSKKICQMDLEGNIIKIWDSIHQASRELPCSVTGLSLYLNGHRSLKTFKNYIWKVIK